MNKIPIIWTLNHKGIDRLKVILRWEVEAKVYGISLHTFSLRTKMKVVSSHFLQRPCIALDDFRSLLKINSRLSFIRFHRRLAQWVLWRNRVQVRAMIPAAILIGVL